MKITCFTFSLLFVFSLFSSTSFAVSKQQKITNAINRYVIRTEIGAALLREVHTRVGPFRYGVACPENINSRGKCMNKRAYGISRKRLTILPAITPADTEYVAWIVAQGMTRLVLTERYQLRVMPKVLEIEQMVFLTAQIIKEEIDRLTPMRRNTDFAASFDHTIARRLDLSSKSFSEAYEPTFLLPFLNKVATRARKKDGVRLSCADVISRDYFSNKQKEICFHILNDFESMITLL